MRRSIVTGAVLAVSAVEALDLYYQSGDLVSSLRDMVHAPRSVATVAGVGALVGAVVAARRR